MEMEVFNLLKNKIHIMIELIILIYLKILD